MHLPIGGYYRLSTILDHGSFRELEANLSAQDPLAFPGYAGKLTAQQAKTGLNEAVVAGVGRIDGRPLVAAVLDSRFFMGSMSSTVGEKSPAASSMPPPTSCPWSSFRPAAAPVCRRASSA